MQKFLKYVFTLTIAFGLLAGALLPASPVVAQTQVPTWDCDSVTVNELDGTVSANGHAEAWRMVNLVTGEIVGLPQTSNVFALPSEAGHYQLQPADSLDSLEWANQGCTFTVTPVTEHVWCDGSEVRFVDLDETYVLSFTGEGNVKVDVGPGSGSTLLPGPGEWQWEVPALDRSGQCGEPTDDPEAPEPGSFGYHVVLPVISQ